jgi:hypothetical protein
MLHSVDNTACVGLARQIVTAGREVRMTRVASASQLGCQTVPVKGVNDDPKAM